MKNSSKTQQPSSGSRSALRVGFIGGVAIGLAIVASRTTTDGGLAALGTIIIIAGLFVVGFYAARDSGDYQPNAASRTGMVAGLIAGLTASMAMVVVSLAQALDPATQKSVIETTNEMMQRTYTPEQLNVLQNSGFTVDAIYPYAIAFQLICCGAGLPIIGLGLGAIGGAIASQIYRNEKAT
jgi:hypothetical protein